MNSKIIKILLLTFLPVSSMGQIIGEIIHKPVQMHSGTSPITISLSVTSTDGIEDVKLLYRQSGQVGFIEQRLERFGNNWEGKIPEDELTVPVFEYYIKAVYIDGRSITFPANEPEITPITIHLEDVEAVIKFIDDSEINESEIIIFSPDPGTTVPFDDVYIAASLFNIDSVDVSTIKLFLDGSNVSAASEITSDVITYSPAELSPGVHSIQINGKTLNGKSFAAAMWKFNVIGEKAEILASAFTYSGRWNNSYSLDQIEGEELSIGKTNLGVTGEWNWLKIKTDIKLTSDEDPLKQPKNRYKFLLSTGKKFKLNIGDVNSRISRYTLDGKRVRGLDASLNLNWVNFRLVTGELDRSIQGSLEPDNSLFLDEILIESDTISGESSYFYKLDRSGYTFKKNITAGRVSFGSGKSFQLGFNLLKAKDDIKSVNQILTDALINIDTDSSETALLDIPIDIYTYTELQNLINGLPNYSLDFAGSGWSGNTPQDNIVIGSDIQIYLDNRNIGIEAGAAFSILNKDIWDGPFSLTALDTLIDTLQDNKAGDFDLSAFPDPSDYEDIFVINENMVPLVPIDPDSTFLADDLTTAIRFMPSLSYNVKTTLNYLKNNLILEYYRNGPQFNSLGNPYLQTNIQEYSIQDRFRLFSNRLFIGLLFKHQDNNVVRNVPVVSMADTRSINLNFFPGPELPSITMSFRVLNRNNGKVQLDTISVDSISTESINYFLEDQRDETTTTNLSLGIRYQIDFFGSENDVSFNYITVRKEDRVLDRADSPYFNVEEFDTTFYDSSYISPALISDVVTFSIVTQYQFPLKTTAMITVNTSEFGPQGILGTQDISNIGFNAVYKLFNNKLKLKAGIDFTKGSGSDSFSRYGIKLGFNYRISDFLSIQTDAELRSKKVDNGTKSSTLLRTGLNYSF